MFFSSPTKLCFDDLLQCAKKIASFEEADKEKALMVLFLVARSCGEDISDVNLKTQYDMLMQQNPVLHEETKEVCFSFHSDEQVRGIIREFQKMRLHKFLSLLPFEYLAEPEEVVRYANLIPYTNDLFRSIILLKKFYVEIFNQLGRLDKDSRIDQCFNAFNSLQKKKINKDNFQKLFFAVNFATLDIQEHWLPENWTGENASYQPFHDLPLNEKLAFYRETKKKRPNLQVLGSILADHQKVLENKELIDLIKVLATVSPIDFLCSLMYDAKSNDITIDNSIAFSVFSKTTDEFPIVIGPTPFFIRKWLHKPALRDTPSAFYVPEDLVETYNWFYGISGSEIRSNIRFLPLSKISEIQDEDWYGNNTINCLIFDNHLETHIPLFPQEGTLDRLQSITILCPSAEFESPNHLKWLFGNNSWTAKEIYIIPPGINASTTPKKKALIVLRHKDDARSCIIKSIKLEKFDRQYLSFHSTIETRIDTNSSADDKSIRKAVRDIEYERTEKREKPSRIDFTGDLPIWYTCEKITYGSGLRVNAYFCLPKEENAVSRGKNIDRTRKITIKCKKDTLESWLSEKYPYEKIFSRGNEDKRITSVREIAAEAFTPFFCGKDIELKTLLYLLPGFPASEEEASILRDALKTELGKLHLFSSPEVYAEVLENCEFENERLVTLLLKKLLDFAQEKGFCKENVFDSPFFKERSEKQDGGLQTVRDALAKRSFTETTLVQSILPSILKHIDNGESAYTAVLIRLFTGLEANIVCALRWSDFEQIPDFGIYHLRVQRQVVNSGEKIIGFDRPEDYRFVPCVDVLAKRLCDLRQQIEALYANRSDICIGDIPIVFSSSEQFNHGTFPIAVSPKELAKITKKIMKEANLPDDIISIPTNDMGDIQTNLAYVRTDIFRENFKHYAREISKLDSGELAYLIGNKAESVFSKNYCDYGADASQFALYVKLHRIDSLLVPQMGFPSGIITESDATFENAITGRGRKMVLIDVTSDQPEVLNVSISTKFGFDFYLSTTGGENDN